jgi:hypothetical protein
MKSAPNDILIYSNISTSFQRLTYTSNKDMIAFTQELVVYVLYRTVSLNINNFIYLFIFNLFIFL